MFIDLVNINQLSLLTTRRITRLVTLPIVLTIRKPTHAQQCGIHVNNYTEIQGDNKLQLENKFINNKATNYIMPLEVLYNL